MRKAKDDRLAKALAEIETLKAQVAALQMQVNALTRPIPQPYQPCVPYTPAPTWPPIVPKPPYEVTFTCDTLPPNPTCISVRSLDAARMVRGVA